MNNTITLTISTEKWSVSTKVSIDETVCRNHEQGACDLVLDNKDIVEKLCALLAQCTFDSYIHSYPAERSNNE